MAKDPAFLFYPNDWIGGTMGMTFEEKGAYMELLMMQFNRGHMTKHMMGQVVGQMLDKVLVKFKEDGNGMYYNERLEEEQNKRKSYVISRVNNKNGTNQHSKKAGHMSSHMEDVNIDSIIVDSLNGSFTEKAKTEILGTVAEMYEIWQKANPLYPKDTNKDYHALLQLAYKIAEANGWEKSQVISAKKFDVLKSWDKIVIFIMKDTWLSTKPLSTILTQWQRIFQEMQVVSPLEKLEKQRVSPEDYFEK